MHSTSTRLLTLALAGAALGACTADRDDAVENGDVAATPATTAAAPAYATWDTDQNGLLNQTEFNTVATERGYNRWNTNGDAGLDRNEFGTGLFGVWDRDRNNQIDETEWNNAVSHWYPAGANYGTYADWNTNGDGWLDTNEFNSGLDRTGFYNGWDTNTDNVIDTNEYDTGLFNLWDTNRDTNIDANEWDLGAGGIDWV